MYYWFVTYHSTYNYYSELGKMNIQHKVSVINKAAPIAIYRFKKVKVYNFVKKNDTIKSFM